MGCAGETAFHPARGARRALRGASQVCPVSLLPAVCGHRPDCVWRNRTSPTASVLSARPQLFIALSDAQFKIHGPNFSKRTMGTWPSFPKNEGLQFFCPKAKLCLGVEAHHCGLNLLAHAFVGFLQRSFRSERFTGVVKEAIVLGRFSGGWGLWSLFTWVWWPHEVTTATSAWNVWLGSPSGVVLPRSELVLQVVGFSDF